MSCCARPFIAAVFATALLVDVCSGVGAEPAPESNQAAIHRALSEKTEIDAKDLRLDELVELV
jgi:hypothetical protein